MSADNGIYILKTPARPIKNGNTYTNQHGKFEYRVAHCQAIDNIEYSDLYLAVLFGDCEVLDDHHKALTKASKMADEILDEGLPLEYGITNIEKDIRFPNLSPADARKALNSYVLEDGKHEFDEKTIELKQNDTDINLCFPNGKKVALQWRIENGSLDICLQENEGINVITWEGIDMTPSKPLKGIKDGHVRANCGQLVLEFGHDYTGIQEE